MALFGKKAKSPTDVSAASPVPPSGENSDFAADVFGSDNTGDALPVGKKGRAAKAPKVEKATKSHSLKNGVAVGLNIGNNLIKAVEVTAKNGELTVTGMGVMVTPPECYSNGNILSISALSNALKSLWKQSGFKAKSAILSVSGTGSLVVRVIEVPKMTDSELSDNMKVDADRYIPFPPSEVIMDFKALRDLPSDPDAPNMEVLLAAAQREVIDLHVKVIQNAKLIPKAIDVEPIATARAVSLERNLGGIEPDYDEVTALLNIGATGTEISVLRGDVIVFTRTLPNGGNSLTGAIAEAFGISFGEAENQKVRLANAIAPAGYAASGDDFTSFDQGFGGDIGSFSDDVFGERVATDSSPFDNFDTGTAPATTSSDPFDMDFFNQGPKQNEPGVGHSQKEGEPPSSTPPAFDFSFGDDLSTMPSQAQSGADVGPSTSPPTNAVSSPGGFAFPDDAHSQEAAQSAVPPPTPTVASAFDFSDFDLPSIAETGTSSTVPTESTTVEPTQHRVETAQPDNFSFGFSEAAAIPSVDKKDAPDESAPKFGFGSTPDSPSLSPEPEAIPSREGESPVSGGFGFGDVPLSPTVEPQVSLNKTSDVGGFDFGSDVVSASAGATPASALSSESGGKAEAFEHFETPGFDADTGNMDFGASTSGSATPSQSITDGFGLDDIQLGVEKEGFDIGEDFQDAEALSFGTGLGEAAVDADAAALYSAISPALEELGAEVRRSLEYHLGRYPDTTFSRIYLVGGGANLKNLDQFFTESLGVPTQVVNPLRFVNVQIPKKGAEEIESLVSHLGPTCATALGLAVRDFVA